MSLFGRITNNKIYYIKRDVKLLKQMGKKNLLTFGKLQRLTLFIMEEWMLSAFCLSIYFKDLEGTWSCSQDKDSRVHLWHMQSFSRSFLFVLLETEPEHMKMP